MTINFKTGSSGWANYVVNGTKEKPRDKEKIEIIDGNPFFTEKIAAQNKFSGEYYKILITVEKKATIEEMKNIYDEVKKNIFVGYKEDEYIASAVLHLDTELPHIHMNVPKQNLLTGQHLQLYMHGIDTKRIQALQDNTALKFGLQTIEEVKPILQEPKETTYEKNRDTPVQYTFQDKKSKALAQQQIKELIKDNIQSINSVEDIKVLVEAHTDLKVTKTDGYDTKKDTHYITIQDKDNKKTTVKGKLFTEDFFKQPKEQQLNQLQVNHKTYSEVEKEEISRQIRENLRRENEKRFKVVQNYGKTVKAEKRAELEILNTKIQKEQKNENPRTTTQTSPRRSPEPTNRQGRQQSPTLAESAIQIARERARTLKTIRKTRTDIYNANAKANRDIQERHRSNTKDIRSKYEAEHTTSNKTIQSIRKRFSRAIKSIGSKIKELFSLNEIKEVPTDEEIEKFRQEVENSKSKKQKQKIK